MDESLSRQRPWPSAAECRAKLALCKTSGSGSLSLSLARLGAFAPLGDLASQDAQQLSIVRRPYAVDDWEAELALRDVLAV
eukprot:scaffold1390_cov249-Pinguiococcus_pyrenoidosus.AAC.17